MYKSSINSTAGTWEVWYVCLSEGTSSVQCFKVSEFIKVLKLWKTLESHELPGCAGGAALAVAPGGSGYSQSFSLVPV